MSDGVMQVPDGRKVQDLVPLLINILEKVRRLPHGPERTAALVQIRNFQMRLTAILLKRAG